MPSWDKVLLWSEAYCSKCAPVTSCSNHFTCQSRVLNLLTRSDPWTQCWECLCTMCLAVTFDGCPFVSVPFLSVFFLVCLSFLCSSFLSPLSVLPLSSAFLPFATALVSGPSPLSFALWPALLSFPSALLCSTHSGVPACRRG